MATTSLDAHVDRLRQSMQHDVALLAEASSAEARRIVSGSSSPASPDGEPRPELPRTRLPRWALPLVLVVVAAAVTFVALPALVGSRKPPPPSTVEAPAKKETKATPAPSAQVVPEPTVDVPRAPEDVSEPQEGHDLVVVTEGVDGVLIRWEDGRGDSMVSPSPLTITPVDEGRVLVFQKKGYETRREKVRFESWSQRTDIRVPMKKIPERPPGECPPDDPFCKDRR
jgi:hypothetical protein